MEDAYGDDKIDEDRHNIKSKCPEEQEDPKWIISGRPTLPDKPCTAKMSCLRRQKKGAGAAGTNGERPMRKGPGGGEEGSIYGHRPA